MDKGISWGSRLKTDKSATVWYKVWHRSFGWQRLVLLSPENPVWSQERNPQRVTQHPESPGAAGSPHVTNSQRQEGLQRKWHQQWLCISQKSASGIRDRTMGGWDVVQPGTSALSHSCNPQADVKQLQQRQPWQSPCSSPQLHCFSPCFCGTGVGGSCQQQMLFWCQCS